MKRSIPVVVSLLVLSWCMPARSQVILTGRLKGPRWAGSSEEIFHAAVHAFAGRTGGDTQPSGHRTWEMHPAGWYFLTGGAGNYTLLFTSPARYVRPLIMTNLFAAPGDKIDRAVTPVFEYAVQDDSRWDEDPARAYYQTFVARGMGVTHVGFKLATDGVDGIGPASQNALLSVHRKGDGTPDTWEQVGPTRLVLNVDCGGAKGYSYSAGWNSGEVSTRPGETYAICLRPESPTGSFQAFWHPDDDATSDCYRVADEGETGFQKHDLYMTIDGDGDGLLIPFNKCVHKEFEAFAGGGAKWSQTYVARGRSLAAVILYAAVGTAEPSLNRQRVAVRVRRGGPDGPVVGTEKIGIGNGTYTGDASWGMFGVTLAPGEVVLEPGQTYAIEFESIENYETLHGHTNIKGVVSNEVPGFNPYRKQAPDTYAEGTAWFEGRERRDYDLDMQIIEYALAADDWARAVLPENLIANGDMEAGDLPTDQNGEGGSPEAWTPFTLAPGTAHRFLADGKKKDNRIVRVAGGNGDGTAVDGGFAQRIAGLSPLETYRLSGRLRSSWPVDEKHQCLVGYDPTGQDTDAEADTIEWATLPGIHGLFVPYESEPIRPEHDAISVWLRGRATGAAEAPFKADFDDFALRQVNTGIPAGKRELRSERTLTPGP